MGVHLNFWRTLNPSCHKNHSKYPILVYSNFLNIFLVLISPILWSQCKNRPSLLYIQCRSDIWKNGPFPDFSGKLEPGSHFIKLFLSLAIGFNSMPSTVSLSGFYTIWQFFNFFKFAFNQITGTKAIQNIEPNDWIKHKTCSYIHSWAQRPFSAPMRQRYGAYSAAT